MPKLFCSYNIYKKKKQLGTDIDYIIAVRVVYSIINDTAYITNRYVFNQNLNFKIYYFIQYTYQSNFDISNKLYIAHVEVVFQIQNKKKN